MLRRLRIAASLFFLLCGAVLMGLWVRSFSWVTNIQTHWGTERAVQCTSKLGVLYFNTFRFDSPADKDEWRAVFNEYHRREPAFERWAAKAPQQFEIRFDSYGRPGFIVRFPYWFAVLVCGVLAALLGLRRPQRYSLRALFIAVGLVAIALGTIVVLSRAGSPRPKPALPEDDNPMRSDRRPIAALEGIPARSPRATRWGEMAGLFATTGRGFMRSTV